MTYKSIGKALLAWCRAHGKRAKGPGASRTLVLRPRPEALDDSGVPVDRADHDRPVGQHGAGEDDRVAQRSAGPDARAVAHHHGPHDLHAVADLTVLADPDRALDVAVLGQAASLAHTHALGD